jgi:hypothetical protein
MFWKKNKQPTPDNEDYFPHPYRFCNLFISDKHKQILFVPYGQVDNGMYAEIDNIIVDNWPCKFEDLETNIEVTLKRFSNKITWIKGKWPSYDTSKAKSQQSYETDYISLRLETDRSRSYGDGEVERIKVTAQPTPLDDTYCLTGTGHLLDTKIAQIVIDILEACIKIRNN